MKSILRAEEIKNAQFGPRDLKDPHSRAYAIQTLYSLKRYLEGKEADQQRIERELETIRIYKHWEVLGYQSEDELLKAEVGLAREELVAKMAQKTKAIAQPGEIGRGRNSCYNVTAKRGNSAQYLTAVIARDHQAIHERMKQGEFESVRQAAIAAGIIEPPTIIEQLKKLWNKTTESERKIFLKYIKR